MGVMSFRGVLMCWPDSGPPLAFFESDGRMFKATNLGVTESDADAADEAIAAALAWGEACEGAPPEGWRVALAGELAGGVRCGPL